MTQDIHQQQTTLDLVLGSDRYRDGSRYQYPAPIELFEAVEEFLPDTEWSVEALKATELQEVENGDVHRSYSRGLFRGRLGSPDAISHVAEVDIAWAWDLRTPVIYVAFGRQNTVCLNLALWRADQTYQFPLLGVTGDPVALLADWVDTKSQVYQQEAADWLNWVRLAKDMRVTRQHLPPLFGDLYIKAATNTQFALGTDILNKAAQSLVRDEDGIYFIPEHGEKSMFDVYSALTWHTTRTAGHVRSGKTLAAAQELSTYLHLPLSS